MINYNLQILSLEIRRYCATLHQKDLTLFRIKHIEKFYPYLCN